MLGSTMPSASESAIVSQVRRDASTNKEEGLLFQFQLENKSRTESEQGLGNSQRRTKFCNFYAKTETSIEYAVFSAALVIYQHLRLKVPGSISTK